ncbi:MAG: kinase/pyrophosphorylase [Burkholderiales bacterium]|nr:MAG: kinase/pyrophosphorylase [Burkholderiales bacterium]
MPTSNPAIDSAMRTVYFVSDGTGITAETLGHSVLTQFESFRYRRVRAPFVDSVDKARELVARINENAVLDGRRPIVFSTLVDPQANAELRRSRAMVLDLLDSFVVPLEQELGLQSTHTIGRSHTMSDTGSYHRRIEAINFALAHDDGQSAHGLQTADVILVGVSRSGKTPTSLYLAMQFGVKAANYPLIPEDFERDELPSALPPHRRKLFGLSISPERLSEVRNERRPDSRYASLENCRLEVSAAERMMRREGIRWLSSTTKSIEEIAATIMNEHRLHRNRD